MGGNFHFRSILEIQMISSCISSRHLTVRQALRTVLLDCLHVQKTKRASTLERNSLHSFDRLRSYVSCRSIAFSDRTLLAAEEQGPPKRLAVFVSGGGSNFKAIHQAILDKSIHGEIVAIVTNAPNCGGANYALDHGIPVLVYPSSAKHQDGLSPDSLAETLQQEYNIDLVILAGYMKLIPEVVVKTFPRAIVNIHPGLLPSFGGKGFYGSRVHQAVVESGARFSGPTVHFIDEEYDTGPRLAQAVVPVYPTDSADILAARVLKEEHKLYPRCVAAICSGRVGWRSDGIPYIWEAL